MAAQVMFIGRRDKKDKFSLSLSSTIQQSFFPCVLLLTESNSGIYGPRAPALRWLRQRWAGDWLSLFVAPSAGRHAKIRTQRWRFQCNIQLRADRLNELSIIRSSCTKKQIAVFLSFRRRLTITSFPISFLRSQFDVAQVFLFYFIYSLSNFLTSRPRLSRRMSSAECEISTSSLSSSRRASRRVSPWMR